MPETSKTRLEFCIESARGLHRASLWKLHWYAVAWVDPTDKYCTQIDVSGSPNPIWRTKFTALLDTTADCTLHLEVYSRDPWFLLEKLHGSAHVPVKEFVVDNQIKTHSGTFQLRKSNSNKPKGFVDISVRAGAEMTAGGNSDVINLAREIDAPNPSFYPPAVASCSYRPTLEVDSGSSSYFNLPPSGRGEPAGGSGGVRPGFAAGVGAGVMAAGAVMFGEGSVSSGFDLASRGVGLFCPRLDGSIDPPFLSQ